MLNTIAVAAKVAAPHLGKAIVAGGKATAFAAVALKAQGYAVRNVSQTLAHIEDAGRAAKRNTTVEVKVTKTQERKAS